MSIEINTENALATHYPVAKPAPPDPLKAPRSKKIVPKIKPDPEEVDPNAVQDLLSPSSIRGFAWSLAAHAALLLILAFWYFAPKITQEVVLDTRLAGSEFGDPSGDQLKGGLGMDTPLAMPQADAPAQAEVTPNPIMTPALADMTPKLPAPSRPASPTGASNGGGLNQKNAGQAGNGDGFGVAKFGHGGENINGVEVKVGDPQFTLIWDSRADVDLHVLEPGGSEIYWEERHGTQGGELDVDDVDGFGPENVNYQLGVGPPGVYRWFVHYYGGLGGMYQPTRWKVRVKHAGKIQTYEGKFQAVGQKSRVYELKVGNDEKSKTPRTAEEAKQSPDGVETTPGAAMTKAASSPPAPPATGPRKFSPAGAGFSVTMPADPKVTRKDYDTSAGAVVAQVYTVERPEGAFSVTEMVFPASAIAKVDGDTFLRDVGKKFADGAQGKVKKYTTNPARGSAKASDLDLDLPDAVVAGGGLGKARIFLDKGVVQIVSAVGTSTFVESAEAADFLGSFQANK